MKSSKRYSSLLSLVRIQGLLTCAENEQQLFCCRRQLHFTSWCSSYLALSSTGRTALSAKMAKCWDAEICLNEKNSHWITLSVSSGITVEGILNKLRLKGVDINGTVITTENSIPVRFIRYSEP